MPEPSGKQLTHDQRRALNASAAARRVADAGDAEPGSHYRSYVNALPATILTCGLGQALATELAAAGADRDNGGNADAHTRLYNDLQDWLCGQADSLGLPTTTGKHRLLDALMHADQPAYRRAQAEAMAWLAWHKKFCRALLDKVEGGDR